MVGSIFIPFHAPWDWNTYQKNYFTSSDPHHDMSGEGCQVNVIYRVKQALQNSSPQQRWPPQ